MTNPARLDTWIWVLIYGGIVLLSLGLMVRRGDGALGMVMAAVGAGLVVAGVVLIGVRSRTKTSTRENPS